MKKKLKSFEKELDSLVHAVTAARNKTFEFVTSHESYLTSKKAGDTSYDPWLTEKKLFKQMDKMIIQENVFQTGMTSLFQGISIFDW